MLIRFRVSNFLSFKEEVELSMLPGNAQSHFDHILPAGKTGIEALRCAAIYGANASGKSNLIKAAAFACKFVKNGVRPKEKIGTLPFKLDKNYQGKPSKFEFEFFIEKKSYLYGFELNNEQVLQEWLYEIKKTTEKMLFERTTEQKNVLVEFGLYRIPKSKMDFLTTFSKGTRPNQLFLTKCFEDENIQYFDEVIKWFLNVEFVFPETKYKHFPIEVAQESQVLSKITSFLQSFDTGICKFKLKKFNPEGLLPENLINDLSTLEDGNLVAITNSNGEFYIVKKEENTSNPEWYRIGFIHHVNGCKSEVVFDMSDESDGTLRLIDLIPMLLIKNKTIWVDEIDRSIHPSLIYKFVDMFLTTKSNTQLIFTTHEDYLLNQDLLRRDEIWFMEKDFSGASSLYSLEEFAPRKDLNIQKGYLLGRFGAIPSIKEYSMVEHD